MGKERGKMRKEISSLPTASILLFELNSLFRACSSSYRIYSFEGVEARSMENLSFCCAANEKHTDDDNAVHVPIILMNKQQIIEKLVWSLSLWSAPATLLSLSHSVNVSCLLFASDTSVSCFPYLSHSLSLWLWIHRISRFFDWSRSHVEVVWTQERERKFVGWKKKLLCADENFQTECWNFVYMFHYHLNSSPETFLVCGIVNTNQDDWIILFCVFSFVVLRNELNSPSSHSTGEKGRKKLFQLR